MIFFSIKKDYYKRDAYIHFIRSRCLQVFQFALSTYASNIISAEIIKIVS